MHNLGAYRVDRKIGAALQGGAQGVRAPGSSVATTTSSSPAARAAAAAPSSTTSRRACSDGDRARYVNRPARRAAAAEGLLVPVHDLLRLVLEAETLIEDYLKETGKARYIIEDDEFAGRRRIICLPRTPSRSTTTSSSLLGARSTSSANRAATDGNSLDPRGRAVEYRAYVMRRRAGRRRAARHEYTSELAGTIVEAFLRDNVIMATHVVAHAAMDILRRSNPELDLYRLLRTGGALP